MPRYYVEWGVDIDSEFGPHEAALQALRIQRDPKAAFPSFRIVEVGGNGKSIMVDTSSTRVFFRFFDGKAAAIFPDIITQFGNSLVLCLAFIDGGAHAPVSLARALTMPALCDRDEARMRAVLEGIHAYNLEPLTEADLDELRKTLQRITG